jgi:dephospho-CoA kinase
MIVVAGPPGSGKSTAFPVAESGVDSSNIDDRAAELNQGSFRKRRFSLSVVGGAVSG